jgi:hypothetical protein
MPIKSRVPADAFDPETIRILTAAFEEVWGALHGNGIGPDADAARDALAKHIITLAQGGERDGNRLRDGALAFMKLYRKPL